MRILPTSLAAVLASCAGGEALAPTALEGAWTMTTTVEEMQATYGNCVHKVGTTSAFEVDASVIEDPPGATVYTVTLAGVYETSDSMIGDTSAWPSLTLDGIYKLRGFPVHSSLQLVVASAAEISGDEQWYVTASGKYDCHGRSTVTLAR